ncbi:unnamed protein product [Echinostoma caproni]|uniref:Uncharacterized protein n=1 Tax=Echinostoma caproni TaxID=27848 RepID=A0A3P8H2A4_9TREM|nr:unnamed protein product [Echinostoma caproni]
MCDFLTTTTNEGTQAVRAALSSRWSTLTNPSLLIASGLLPAGSPFSFNSADLLLDMVGLSSGTTKSGAFGTGPIQKKRSQEPTSALCHRLLVENVDKVGFGVGRDINRITTLFKKTALVFIPMHYVLNPFGIEDFVYTTISVVYYICCSLPPT